MKQIYSKLKRPFVENFTFLILLLILITSIDVFYQIQLTNYKYAAYVIAHGFVYSYIVSFIVSFIHTKMLRWSIKVFVLCICTFYFFINYYCIYTYSSLFFPGDLAAIMLGTNIKEIVEFFTSYIPPQIVCFCIFFAIIEVLLYNVFSRRKNILSKKMINISFIYLLFCSVLTLHNRALWKELILGDICNFYDVAITPSLKDYVKEPDIEVVSQQPKNIVFIIGESFSKSHSSLYGYEKKTNPYLSELVNDSSLMIFSHVKAPGLHTIASFKAMMSTYRPMHNDKRNWYECLTLPEIIRKANYYSQWISNQSEIGFYDNIVSQYAHLCDNTNFIGSKYAELNRITYDELVLEPLNQLVNRSSLFYFIHLMGSHPDFRKRYPDQFNKFTENDYMSYPPNQRYKLATYDNSILYNDSVVNQIIMKFQDKEAIVLYFSDHGLDTYVSSDSYIGHAKFNNAVSREAGYNIPFMVYCSPAYKKNYPLQVKRLKDNLHKVFNTEDLIYTAMDIMGVRFKRNYDVDRYSLLSD